MKWAEEGRWEVREGRREEKRRRKKVSVHPSVPACQILLCSILHAPRYSFVFAHYSSSSSISLHHSISPS